MPSRAQAGRGLPDDHGLAGSVEHEKAVLLQLVVTDVDQRLDNLFDVLARNVLTHRFGHRIENRALRERLLLAFFAIF